MQIMDDKPMANEWAAQTYSFDEATGVWTRQNYESIAYSDGDASELRLKGIIDAAGDLGVFSAELAAAVVDWPSQYHLSAERANLLRPFAHLYGPQCHVLEIGAGCGAISRYLGESGCQLLALEGSLRRASIAASRTRDLANVTVVAERFEDFSTSQRFDIITMIGVLEYASLFTEEKPSALRMLERVRGLLAPGGRLIIAIENQLGLKYFAGVPEDHLGEPMAGIEDRYGAHGPRTFGRKALARLLAEADLDQTRFFAPFPDYKMPVSIVTEAGALASDFDGAALAWQSTKYDSQIVAPTSFNLGRAWPSVFDNQLGLDLANSFLIEAMPAVGSEEQTAEILAYHYSTRRLPRFSRETFFVRAGESIEVRAKLLQPDQAQPLVGARHHLIENAPYTRGVLLAHGVVDVVTSPDWTISALVRAVRDYINALRDVLAEQQIHVPLLDIDERLPAGFLDATPQNLLRAPDRSVVYIDGEWESTATDISFGWLLFRGLLWTLSSLPMARLKNGSTENVEWLIAEVFESLGMPLSQDIKKQYLIDESVFQSVVSGVDQSICLSHSESVLAAGLVSQASGLKGVLTLYFAAQDEAFSEASTVVVNIEEQRTRCRIQLPADMPAGANLRIDPSDRSGWLAIHEITLCDASSKEQWTWRPGRGGVHFVGTASFVDETHLDGAFQFSWGSDPQALLDLPQSVRQFVVPGSELFIDLEINDPPSYPADFRATAFVHDDLIRQQKDLAERDASLAQRIKNVSDTEAQVIERALALMADEAAMKLIMAQTLAEQAAVNTIKTEVLAEQAAVNAIKTEVLAEQAAVSAIKAEVMAEQAVIKAVKAQTSWQIANRLNAIAMRLPAWIRRALRNVLKTTWWAITPWRLSRRLRLRRAYKLNAQRRGVAQGVPLPRVRGSSPLERKFLRFVVQNDSSAGDARSGNGPSRPSHYVLQAAPADYCYLPPDRPRNGERLLDALTVQPFFSIVVPVYNTPADLLEKLVASVRSQWYQGWELILVDDNSSLATVQDALNALDDPSIVIIRLVENKRIAGATNEGIAAARGDYIVFLDHDDELTADCLHELALCIDRDDPDFIYSDEDKIDTDGSFTQPFFKPDWSPDTMMSTMFTCHVSCVRRTLVQELGGLRGEYDGSQDWDFILRVVERTRRIVHIPKVLYHWRIIPASLSSDITAKPYAVDAGKRAREDALRRRGISGSLKAVPEIPGYFRTSYDLVGRPAFSIVIPSKNNGKILQQCLDSIFQLTAYPNFEIVLIDNGSTDKATIEYVDSLKVRERISVLHHNAPFNYSEINNLGVRHAKHEILVFLNDDTEVLSPDWLDYMGGYAQQAHVGAVGAKLLYPGGELVQHVGVINLSGGPNHAFSKAGVNDPGYFARNLLEHDWVAVTGACMMIERVKFDAVGGFDEALPVAYNDVELCFRLVEHGLYNVVCPSIHLIHHESLSRGLDAADTSKAERLKQDMLSLYRKHPDFYLRDPFHNPNFAPDDVHFGLPR